MEKSKIYEIVVRIVESESGRDQIDVSHTFYELDIESLTFAEILMSIEDELQLELALEEEFALSSSATVADLIGAVVQKSAAFGVK
ncbi:acyl carrier protein [Aurantimicrobium minutum]|uniref:phosphopantetheine-binding protein n=1 Tax=Aurantimicrobium minutum TaxID=708131 RepID=UPI0024054EA9|nr:phosphopantetheine-binding protein [Aurantimicrobium minutum]MDF9809180.1 acyl carrier protein [Aurantimicrobium minutum]